MEHYCYMTPFEREQKYKEFVSQLTRDFVARLREAMRGHEAHLRRRIKEAYGTRPQS